MPLKTAPRLVQRFGLLAGLRLYAQLKLAKSLPGGSLIRADVPTLPHPVFLRARTTDTLVLKQVIFEDVAAFHLPSPPAFVVDAGANIGLSSATLATRYPSARIIALELDAANFAILERNVAPYPNITPIHAGLWSKSTTLAVANPETSAWAFRARESQSASEGVQGLSVSDVMQRFDLPRIDLLKVDIEGGEREVFGPEAEAWLDRVSWIAVELHDRLVPGCEEAVVSRLGSRFDRSQAGEYEVFSKPDPQRR